MHLRLIALLTFGLAAPWAAPPTFAEDFLPKSVTSSTVPPNGDLNPYGVAFVPAAFPAGGAIQAGDVLVSNFNNTQNLQGTGTTIVQLTPNGVIAPLASAGSPGSAQVFFQSELAGLTTALGVLTGGFVIVGNLPTTDGTFHTIGQGALQVVDSHGNWLATWTDPDFLDSPWDLTINDGGDVAQIYVSNVLSAKVVRLDVSVASNGVSVVAKHVIASGYKHRPNAAALVLGPTGLVYDATSDALFVASTADNAIYRISGASRRVSSDGVGVSVFAGSELRGPLALVATPNGHLMSANGDAVRGDPKRPSEVVEFTRAGEFVREANVDAGQGGAFGLATATGLDFNYAAVDDVPNVVIVTKVRE